MCREERLEPRGPAAAWYPLAHGTGGRGRAGGVGLCSSAPGAAGVRAAPRSSVSSMAGPLALRGVAKRGWEVTNEGTPGTGCGERGAAQPRCSPREVSSSGAAVSPASASPLWAGDLQNLAGRNVSPLSAASRRARFPLRGRAVIAPAAPETPSPAQHPCSAFQSLPGTEEAFPGAERCCQLGGLGGFQPFHPVSLNYIKFWGRLGGTGTAPLVLPPWETSLGIWLGAFLSVSAVDIWVCLGVCYCRNPSYRAEAAGWDPAVQTPLPGDVGGGAAARSARVLPSPIC